jgi:hypothetical protein
MAAVALAGLAAVAAPLLQQNHNFAEQMQRAEEHHHKAMALAQKRHTAQQQLEAVLQQRRHATAKELHYRSMSHGIEIARREAARDVWSQKNQLIQTLMMIDTVLFSCAFSLAVEGWTPPATSPTLNLLNSVVTSASLGVLFLSIWLTVKLQARMARYDVHHPRLRYVCGHAHLAFNDYFQCHCARLELVAFGAFYVGTMLTVAAAAVFMTAVFTAQFDAFWLPAGLFLGFCAVGFNAPLLTNRGLKESS